MGEINENEAVKACNGLLFTPFFQVVHTNLPQVAYPSWSVVFLVLLVLVICTHLLICWSFLPVL